MFNSKVKKSRKLHFVSDLNVIQWIRFNVHFRRRRENPIMIESMRSVVLVIESCWKSRFVRNRSRRMNDFIPCRYKFQFSWKLEEVAFEKNYMKVLELVTMLLRIELEIGNWNLRCAILDDKIFLICDELSGSIYKTLGFHFMKLRYFSPPFRIQREWSHINLDLSEGIINMREKITHLNGFTSSGDNKNSTNHHKIPSTMRMKRIQKSSARDKRKSSFSLCHFLVLPIQLNITRRKPFNVLFPSQISHHFLPPPSYGDTS